MMVRPGRTNVCTQKASTGLCLTRTDVWSIFALSNRNPSHSESKKNNSVDLEVAPRLLVSAPYPLAWSLASNFPRSQYEWVLSITSLYNEWVQLDSSCLHWLCSKLSAVSCCCVITIRTVTTPVAADGPPAQEFNFREQLKSGPGQDTGCLIFAVHFSQKNPIPRPSWCQRGLTVTIVTVIVNLNKWDLKTAGDPPYIRFIYVPPTPFASRVFKPDSEYFEDVWFALYSGKPWKFPSL